MMETLAMWELAEGSTYKLAVIAVTLAATEGYDVSRKSGKRPLARLLVKFAGYLEFVSIFHDKLDHHPTGPDRIRKLLEALEHLCSFPVSGQLKRLDLDQPNCPFPILSALKAWTPGDDSPLASMIGDCIKAFLSTEPHTDGNTKQGNRAKAFSSRVSSAKTPPSPVRKYLAFLKSFSETKRLVETQVQTTDSNNAARSAKDIDTPSDFPAHVHKTLFKLLMKKYSQCCCTSSVIAAGGIRRHRGRLRLKETVKIHEDNVVFDTVFSKSPHVDTATKTEWQQLQFEIPM